MFKRRNAIGLILICTIFLHIRQIYILQQLFPLTPFKNQCSTIMLLLVWSTGIALWRCWNDTVRALVNKKWFDCYVYPDRVVGWHLAKMWWNVIRFGCWMDCDIFFGSTLPNVPIWAHFQSIWGDGSEVYWDDFWETVCAITVNSRIDFIQLLVLECNKLQADLI